MKTSNDVACPCGGLPAGAPYRRCCGLFIEGGKLPDTAEHLMRSRYTAYARGLADYLLATWHPSTRPQTLTLDQPDTPHGIRWIGLRIQGGKTRDTDHAEVRFTARFREAGKGFRLVELSRFVRENERWFYVDGDIEDSA